MIGDESAAICEGAFQRSAAVQKLPAINECNERLLIVKVVDRFGNVAGDDNLVPGANERLGDSFEKCCVWSDCYN